MKTKQAFEQAKARYIKNGGNTCLNCGSEHIEGGSFNTDSGVASQSVWCNECDWEWDDIYALTDIKVDKNLIPASFNVWEFTYSDGITTKQAKLAIDFENSEEAAKNEFNMLTKHVAISAEIVGQC